MSGPARAVRCAGAITETVGSIGLVVRGGVHTGEIELMEAGVGGIAVHIGARIAVLTDPSEVLVSSTVKDLTAAWDSYSRTRASTNSRAYQTVGVYVGSSAEVTRIRRCRRPSNSQRAASWLAQAAPRARGRV